MQFTSTGTAHISLAWFSASGVPNGMLGWTVANKVSENAADLAQVPLRRFRSFGTIVNKVLTAS